MSFIYAKEKKNNSFIFWSNFSILFRLFKSTTINSYRILKKLLIFWRFVMVAALFLKNSSNINFLDICCSKSSNQFLKNLIYLCQTFFFWLRWRRYFLKNFSNINFLDICCSKSSTIEFLKNLIHLFQIFIKGFEQQPNNINFLNISCSKSSTTKIVRV